MCQEDSHHNPTPNPSPGSARPEPTILYLVGGLSNFVDLTLAPASPYGTGDSTGSGHVVPLTATVHREIQLPLGNSRSLTASLYIWGHRGSDGLSPHALLAFLLPN